MLGMKTRKPAERQRHTDHYDYVTLADGTIVAVPRGNLAAAKGLLAAQKAAERRVAAKQQQREILPARRHLQPVRQDQAIYRVATSVGEVSQRTGAPASDSRVAERELQRITLPVALPCALGDCGQPTRTALIEPDPDAAGLWSLLPVCEDGERHSL